MVRPDRLYCTRWPRDSGRRVRGRTSWGRSMRRRLLIGLGTAGGAGRGGYAAAWALGTRPAEVIGGLVARTRPPIVVGLLHSQTGPMAISEKSLIDAERMAVEEINARGGVAGRLIEVRDGRRPVGRLGVRGEARRLIEAEKVSVIFGAYTSESRKAVRAVVEELQSLLFVPGNFEGMERSPRVIYAGGSANQSVPPAVRWARGYAEGPAVLRGGDRGGLVEVGGGVRQGLDQGGRGRAGRRVLPADGRGRTSSR